MRKIVPWLITIVALGLFVWGAWGYDGPSPATPHYNEGLGPWDVAEHGDCS